MGPGSINVSGLGINGKTVAVGGNLTTAGAFTTFGAFNITLTATGNSNVTLPASGTLAALGLPQTWSAPQTFTGAAGTPAAVSISGGALNFDVSAGTVFTVTSNANITSQTFSNVPSGKAVAFEVDFTANGTGFSQTWPCSFPGGVTPTLTATNGKLDRISYYTPNGGLNWYCTIISQNY